MKNTKPKLRPKYKPKRRAPTLRERIRDLECDVCRLQEWVEALRGGRAVTTASCTGSGELEAKRPRYRLRGQVTFRDLGHVGLDFAYAMLRQPESSFELTEARDSVDHGRVRTFASGDLRGCWIPERFVEEVKP